MRTLLKIVLFCLMAGQLPGQPMTVVKPTVSDAVLNNPGIGFTTFQRFNGDALNSGVTWTEGMPIDYQTPKAGHDPGYPDTAIAYFRVYWRFLEPKKGEYRWEMIDRALKTAHDRGQTLMIRIAPHGREEKEDVPSWYREETGEVLKKGRPATTWTSTVEKWMVDPENPAYAREFGGFIRKFAERYDGHPDVELVDISVLAAWGEGAGLDLLKEETRRALLDSYLDAFHKTPLVSQLADPRTIAYTQAKARNFGAVSNAAAPLVGWRADCMGDMGGFSPTWNFMVDGYPEEIVGDGFAEAWKQAPVTMEACWVMQQWKDNGWSLRYIMDQAIKWHVSTFNNKSSAVPEAWWPQVNEWLNHMGYRFALRRFAYTQAVDGTRRLSYASWWENKGNAPIYREYAVSLRIKGEGVQVVLPLKADPRTWMPGDSIADGSVFLPTQLRDGEYKMAIAITEPGGGEPRVKLAIDGVGADGWFTLGSMRLRTTDR